MTGESSPPLYAYPEEISGDGLRLRRATQADAPAVRRAMDDPETRRFLTPVTDDAGALAWAGADANRIRERHGERYVVFDGAELIGGVTVTRVVPERDQAEVGYWVAASARGKGVATRAVRAVVRAAFDAGLGRIELLAEPENIGSHRVAVAAGFHREGVRRMPGRRRGGRFDFVAWSRLITDSGEPMPRLIPDLAGGVLTDGVVTLRPLAARDVDDIVHLMSFPEVLETNFGDNSAEAWQRKCDRAQYAWIAGERADMVITDAETGAFAGDIGFYYFTPGLHEGMLGYSLLPAYRGRGYATRAVNLVARWAFDHVCVARLIAGTDPANEGSQRVLQRAGFAKEAYMRDRLPGPDGTRLDDIQWVRLPPR